MSRQLTRYSARQAAELIPETGISTPQAFAKALELWHSKAVNVITPIQALGEISEDYKVVATAVLIDPKPAAGEVYTSSLFHDDGECSLTKVALDKIASAAGLSWEESRRIDDGKVEHVIDWFCRATYLSPFGERQSVVASNRLDLRNGSAYIASWKPGQIKAARAKALERAESICMNRAIRKLGLAGKTTFEQVAKPFIAVRTICQPVDPETRRQMLLGASGVLGPAQPAEPMVIDMVPGQVPPPDADPEMGPATAAADPEPEDYPDDIPWD